MASRIEWKINYPEDSGVISQAQSDRIVVGFNNNDYEAVYHNEII